MKTERIVYIILIVLLVVINGVLLYNNYLNWNSNEENPINVNDKNSLFDNITNLADSSFGLKINKEMKLKTHTGKSIMLRDIIIELPVLVFDFHEINCRTCVDDEILRLIEIAKVIGKDRVLFISKFDNQREQYALEQKYNIRIYNSEMDEFGLPVENEFVPFIFIIDKEYVTGEFYVPTSEFYRLGNIYFSLILNKYFGESWF